VGISIFLAGGGRPGKARWASLNDCRGAIPSRAGRALSMPAWAFGKAELALSWPAPHPGGNMPLSLNDDEYAAVQAAPIHPLQRGAFLQALAEELEKHPVVGPGLVHRLAADLQRTFGVTVHSTTLHTVGPRHRGARQAAGRSAEAPDRNNYGDAAIIGSSSVLACRIWPALVPPTKASTGVAGRSLGARRCPGHLV
jgi:hypothetical protein